MNIVDRVFELLESQHKSQSELAEFLSVDRAVVSQWKRRSTDIFSRYVIPISDFFGVSTHYLLTGENEKEKAKADTQVRVMPENLASTGFQRFRLKKKHA